MGYLGLTPMSRVGGIYLYSDVELRIAEFMQKANKYLYHFKQDKATATAIRIAGTEQELNELIAELEYIKKRIYGAGE